MNSRRLAWMIIAMFLVTISVLLLGPKTNAPFSRQGEKAKTNRSAPLSRVTRPALLKSSRSLTPAELEINRLEEEFYKEFPLALKLRDYESGEAGRAEREILSDRLKSYVEEPSDVRTKNLRTGNLNMILELEAALIFKESLAADSELGQMLRVSFNAPRWDWKHMLRNLDDRIGSSSAVQPAVETAEQLAAELQSREKRIFGYCQKRQEEASMPDSIRQDIRDFALDHLTRGVVQAYLETITPAALKEMRRRVERERKEQGLP